MPVRMLPTVQVCCVIVNHDFGGSKAFTGSPPASMPDLHHCVVRISRVFSNTCSIVVVRIKRMAKRVFRFKAVKA